MTREEAIQVLADIKRIRSDEISEAVDMAISALSAEPSDLISREEVKRVLREVWIHDAKMPMGADPFLALAMQDIEDIPSVSADRPSGEWIDDKPNLRSAFAKEYRCSNCGARHFNYTYCPSCGAYMKGGDSE